MQGDSTCHGLPFGEILVFGRDAENGYRLFYVELAGPFATQRSVLLASPEFTFCNAANISESDLTPDTNP